MASSRQPPSTLLAGLAEDRATGALRVGRAGTIYLTDGRVTYVESTVAPRVEEILTASSRISAAAVRKARRTAAETADGGEALVRQGVLTRGELQFCVLGVIADAAYFVLAATGARQRFRAGDRHWLGVHWYADATGLIRECARRRAQLDNIWPSDELDTEPLVPVSRPPGQRVVLTALQWELLTHADRVATPVELARRLGRPAYATLAAVRHLAAAGLLCRPESAKRPAPARAEPRTPPRPGPAENPAIGPAIGPGPSPGIGPAAEAAPVAVPEDLLAAAAGGLPRRTPGASAAPRPATAPAPAKGPTLSKGSAPVKGSAPEPAPAGLAPAVTGDPTDVGLLIRLRNALEQLL